MQRDPATASGHASGMNTDAEYRSAVAWGNAFLAEPDAALMILRKLHAGMIEEEQAVMAWQKLTHFDDVGQRCREYSRRGFLWLTGSGPLKKATPNAASPLFYLPRCRRCSPAYLCGWS
jgi:hypothetical protein